jgi:hypothetical protein
MTNLSLLGVEVMLESGCLPFLLKTHLLLATRWTVMVLEVVGASPITRIESQNVYSLCDF